MEKEQECKMCKWALDLQFKHKPLVIDVEAKVKLAEIIVQYAKDKE